MGQENGLAARQSPTVRTWAKAESAGGLGSLAAMQAAGGWQVFLSCCPQTKTKIKVFGRRFYAEFLMPTFEIEMFVPKAADSNHA